MLPGSENKTEGFDLHVEKNQMPENFKVICANFFSSC